MRFQLKWAAITLQLAAVLAASGQAQESLPPAPKPDEIAPVSASPAITIAGKNEPGERLVVDGLISGSDGKPMPDVSIYAYHTDSNGHYDPNEAPNRQGAPRLKGYMRTDAAGRYRFSTIRPAPYPGRRIPAHVHFVVNSRGYRDVYLEMLFSGDPLITDEHRAASKDNNLAYKFSICQVTRDADGAWRCTQNFVLAPK